MCKTLLYIKKYFLVHLQALTSREKLTNIDDDNFKIGVLTFIVMNDGSNTIDEIVTDISSLAIFDSRIQVEFGTSEASLCTKLKKDDLPEVDDNMVTRGTCQLNVGRVSRFAPNTHHKRHR